MTSKMKILDEVLNGLISRYGDRVPDVNAIVERMITAGLIQSRADVQNDHIAFRTMGVPNLGIKSLERIFLHYGYVRRDQYDFPVKKLTAHWYSPPEPHYPRIFISQLRVEELSEHAQNIIRSYTDEVTQDPVQGLDLDDAAAVDSFLHQPLWRTPTWDDYLTLSKESEYAAWVIYNRYYLNHFTISVHNLPEGYNTISQFNVFLEANGFELNDSGGKEKISADGMLRQSSTVAEMIDATFDDGHSGAVVKRIPGSYVEFAERRPIGVPGQSPEGSHARREGFEAENADRIFESTYNAQTSRREKTAI